VTPHHLSPYGWHALAAAHSLHDARVLLAIHVDREARHNTSSLRDAAPLLRSPIWGVRHASGGHGDPTSAILTLERGPARVTTWADISRRLDGRLTWLAQQIRATVAEDPWWAVYETLPRLLPGTAAVVARHLADDDAWVRSRDVLDLPAAVVPLPGEPVPPACPACRQRNLHIQQTGPIEAWTVVCAGEWRDGRHNPCLCVGAGCGCGMEVAVEGVAHIWPRAAVLAGVRSETTSGQARIPCEARE